MRNKIGWPGRCFHFLSRLSSIIFWNSTSPHFQTHKKYNSKFLLNIIHVCEKKNQSVELLHEIGRLLLWFYPKPDSDRRSDLPARMLIWIFCFASMTMRLQPGAHKIRMRWRGSARTQLILATLPPQLPFLHIFKSSSEPNDRPRRLQIQSNDLRTSSSQFPKPRDRTWMTCAKPNLEHMLIQ